MNKTEDALAKTDIRQREGFRGDPYDDETGITMKAPSGNATIGYGTLLPISREEADLLLEHRYRKVARQCSDLLFWGRLDVTRRCVLLDLGYNLGFSGLLKFKKMLAAIKREDWRMAGAELMDSNYGRGVTASRARLNRNRLILGDAAMRA
jgi:lysozyme